MVRQLKIYLRAADVRAIYADPDRMEQERVWAAYARGIGAIAWRQGNKETEFVRRWRDLIAARTDAEEYDDEAAVRAIEGRLDRMTAPVMFPQYPAAAWEAADTPPEANRQVEYDRLEAKYGSRHPSTNGTANKIRGRRQTRSTPALEHS